MEKKYTTYKILISRIVKNIRIIKKIDQYELSKSMKIAQASFSRRETNMTNYSAPEIIRIARKFEIKPSKIFSIADIVERDLEKLDIDIFFDEMKNKELLETLILDSFINLVIIKHGLD